MGKSSKDDGRWLWIPPTLIVVGVAAFAINQARPEEKHPNRQERLLQRADALCAAHQPPGTEPGLSGPATAGDMVSTAKFLGRPADPWSDLPSDHFVARCSYPPTARDPEALKTCPDGERYDLTPPIQLLVDEEGRTSIDFGGVQTPADPC
jgi:hypothetical protein